MKIALFCGNSAFSIFGGAEKVFCDFADEFVRRGCEVAAIVDEPQNVRPVYPLDARVRYFNVNPVATPKRLLRRLKIWREATRPLRKTPLKSFFPNPFDFFNLYSALDDFRPDVVIPFFTRDLNRLCLRRPNRRNDFALVQTLHGPVERSIPQPPTRRDLRNLARCDVVQVLTPGFEPAARRFYAGKIAVIPNVVPQFAERVDFEERERAARKRIICVGRLDPIQKRQRLAIEAFAQIAAARPDWDLYFFGSSDKKNEYRNALLKLIEQRSLSDRIFVCPPTLDVKSELLKSDIFAFPSAFEGFGLALGEALSAGLPAVGYRAAPAVDGLIRDGENGFLAEDGVDDFARKLATLTGSKELRAKFGAAAKKSVEKYEASKIWDAWEHLLVETVAAKRAKNGERDNRGER